MTAREALNGLVEVLDATDASPLPSPGQVREYEAALAAAREVLARPEREPAADSGREVVYRVADKLSTSLWGGKKDSADWERVFEAYHELCGAFEIPQTLRRGDE